MAAGYFLKLVAVGLKPTLEYDVPRPPPARAEDE
jgi:hypothetical protein